MSVLGTALVEGADGRVYAVPVLCGDDRPQAGRSTRVVLSSHGAYARGSLLRGGTRMDHQRDSGWIEPLEAAALSADEETESKTPVSAQGDVRRTESDEMICSCVRRRGRGCTIMEGRGGVVRLPPWTRQDLPGTNQGQQWVCRSVWEVVWSVVDETRDRGQGCRDALTQTWGDHEVNFSGSSAQCVRNDCRSLCQRGAWSGLRPQRQHTAQSVAGWVREVEVR